MTFTNTFRFCSHYIEDICFDDIKIYAHTKMSTVFWQHLVNLFILFLIIYFVHFISVRCLLGPNLDFGFHIYTSNLLFPTPHSGSLDQLKILKANIVKLILKASGTRRLYWHYYPQQPRRKFCFLQTGLGSDGSHVTVDSHNLKS